MARNPIHSVREAKWRPLSRLSVVYVSASIGRHAVSEQFSAAFQHHDRRLYGASVVALNPPDDSQALQTIRRHAQTRHLHGVPPGHVAKEVAASRPHILISLDCGHSGKVPGLPALQVAGYRPAPVQGCHIGLQGSTGASFMQYRHSDLVSSPPSLSSREAFSESLALLPHSNLICNHRKLHVRLRSLRAIR